MAGGPMTQQLVEREEELRLLCGALDAAASGSGRMILLRGPAGIGKTTLLRALRSEAAARDVHVLGARGSELERDFPFGGARQLFATTVAERPEVLQGAAALAAPALDPVAAPAGDVTAHAVMHGLHWLAVTLASERPLLLAVDDVQWVDPASLRFLAFLARRADELRGLLVVVQRTGEAAADPEAMAALTHDPEALVIEPGPLSEQGVEAVLADALGRAPEPALVSACRQSTGGNPFLLRQLARSTDDGTDPAAIPDMGPRSVAASVMIRIARMSAAEPAVAKALAVLGDGALLRDVAEIAALSAEVAQGAVDRLARAEIVTQGEQLSFVHPIVRRAVYSDMDAVERGRLHRDAARLRLAERRRREAVPHLLAATPRGDAEVVEHLRAAADDALAAGDAGAAADLLERALAEPPAPEDRGGVLEALGQAELRAARPEAIEHLSQAIEAAPDPITRARVGGSLARALIYADRAPEGVALLDEVLEALGGEDRELGLLLEGEFAAAVFLAPGAESVTGTGLRMARRQDELRGDTPGERLCLGSLSLHRASRGATADEARDLARRALGGGALLVEAGPESIPFVMTCVVLCFAEAWDEAEEGFDQQLAEAQRRGSPLGFTLASAYRCHVLRRRGELARAEAEGRAAWEVCRDYGFDTFAPLVLGFLLDSLTESGQLDAAEELVRDAGLAIEEQSGDVVDSGFLAARGRLRLVQRRPEDALVDLEASMRLEAAGEAVFDFAGPPAARARALCGDQDRALEIARAEVERWRAWGTPRALGSALSALGTITGGDEGIALLREAVGVLESSECRYDHAVALCDLGAALRRANQRAEGRERLREALDLAKRCGATRLAEEATEELRAAGGRVHREFLSGVEALTPSELRIARLAAEGLSNPEIAQSLFLTRKTVEMHLGRVYRKLDLASRAELPAALAAA